MMTRSTISPVNLPPEIVFDILMTLPVDDILQRCRTSKFFNDICNNEYFWKMYAQSRDIPLTKQKWKESVADVTFIKKHITPRNNSEKILFNSFGLPKEIFYRIDDNVLVIKFKFTGHLASRYDHTITNPVYVLEDEVRYKGYIFVEDGIITIVTNFYYVLGHDNTRFNRKYKTINGYLKDEKDTLINNMLMDVVLRQVPYSTQL